MAKKIKKFYQRKIPKLGPYKLKPKMPNLSNQTWAALYYNKKKKEQIIVEELLPCTTGLLAWNDLNNTYIAYDGKTRANDKMGVRDEEVLQGKCYDFDGVAYIDLDSADVGAEVGYTLIFDIERNSVANNVLYCEDPDVGLLDNRLLLRIQSDNSLLFFQRDGDGSILDSKLSTFGVENGFKGIVAARKQGTSLSLFKDALKEDFTIQQMTNYNPLKRIIGYQYAAQGFNFAGKMGRIAIIKAALTDDEIANFDYGVLKTYLDSGDVVFSSFCNEEAEAISVNLADDDLNGTITNATLANFHATDNYYINIHNNNGYAEVDTNTAKYPYNTSGQPIIPPSVIGNITLHDGRVKRSIEVIFASGTVLTEGFENAGAIPTGWTTEILSGTEDWRYIGGGNNGNPPAAHTGAYNAYLFRSSTSGNEVRLISPEIDLSVTSQPKLKFWLAMIDFAGDQDELRVEYRISPSDPWIEIFAKVDEAADWTQFELSLPNPSSTYQIAFKGNAVFGRGVCVDDVEVSGSSETVYGFEFLDVPRMNLWNKLDANVWGSYFAGTPDAEKFQWTESELLLVPSIIQSPYDQQLFIKQVGGPLTHILTYEGPISGECLNQTNQYTGNVVEELANDLPINL